MPIGVVSVFAAALHRLTGCHSYGHPSVVRSVVCGKIHVFPRTWEHLGRPSYCGVLVVEKDERRQVDFRMFLACPADTLHRTVCAQLVAGTKAARDDLRVHSERSPLVLEAKTQDASLPGTL